MEKSAIIVTQARLGSTRLPNKVLMKINGSSLLQIHLSRLKKCKNVSEIIVATTTKEEDSIIYETATLNGCSSFKGSETDVLDRYYQAVKGKKPDWIVRVTSDCPLIDPILIDQVIEFVQESNVDYGSNIFVEHYPDGQDIEVFKFSALEKAWQNAVLQSDREHVTTFIRNHSDLKGGLLFRAINYPCNSDFSNIRMTVDENKDLELVTILVNALGIDKSWLEYTRYILENDLNKINGSIIRNEGLLKSLKNEKNG